MLNCVMRLIAVVSLLWLLTCCSEVPPLTSEPRLGPSVPQIANHINCELASIIASNPSTKKPLTYYGPIDPIIEQREAFDGSLRYLIPHLQDDHFVASVLLTLDTTDTEGLFPSASFIHPFTTMFNKALGVGGQLSGSQERNVTVGYSIDLANVGDGCIPWETIGPKWPLNGNLRLGDIIADGLTGLDATSRVNVYSSGGPTRPAFDATLGQMKLAFSCSNSNGEPCKEPYETEIDLTLSGNVNFAPASDPQSPGSLSFSGRAKNGKDSYLMTLTGSTIEVDAPKHPKLKFSLSGTMTRESVSESSVIAPSIGYSPSISLVGTVDDSRQLVRGLKQVTGLLTPSSELLPQPTGTKIVYNIGGPDDSTSGGAVVFNGSKFKTNQITTGFLINGATTSGANSTGASASATAKSTASTSAGSTQFGSLVSFMITYGLNGGPNWTLSNFKGPGGGTGPNGNLFSVTRAHIATLQLTFVAACNDGNNPQIIHTFWESIPKCNGTQQAQAAATGQSLNYLAASGRGGQ
jgi:hypothetical protein